MELTATTMNGATFSRPRGLRRLAGALLARCLPLLAALPSTLATTLLPVAEATAADRPPAGRYRCYQPPRYTVVSWFDLDPDGTYRVLDEAPAPYRYEPAGRRVVWLKGDHAQRGWLGLYLPPQGDGAGGIRHTIVMTSPKNHKPPTSEQDPRPQCYLTTH